MDRLDKMLAETKRVMREAFPNGCELCGEEADAEMGEFVLPDKRHVVAHVQCGLDNEGEVA